MTVSEALFEHYLTDQNLAFAYEPTLDERRKHPDYRVTVDGQELLLEVKEFAREPYTPGPKSGGACRPLPGIREKINQAAKQFTEFKDRPCSLVLYNPGHPRIEIHEPHTIFEAMLGDSGIAFHVEAGRLRGPQEVLEGNAKMLRNQNTTISAILVLQEYLRGQPRGRIDEQQAWKENPTLTVAPTDLASRTLLRVIRHDNPFARKPLPPSLFHGPADETWEATALDETPQGTEMRFARTFAGPLADHLWKHGPYAPRQDQP